MRCASCGSMNPASAPTCARCGKPQHAAGTPPPPATPPAPALRGPVHRPSPRSCARSATSHFLKEANSADTVAPLYRQLHPRWRRPPRRACDAPKARARLRHGPARASTSTAPRGSAPVRRGRRLRRHHHRRHAPGSTPSSAAAGGSAATTCRPARASTSTAPRGSTPTATPPVAKPAVPQR